ncbi:Long-chain-fatty-acid--CoA ligase [bacterium HR40]|nr:Long-chain-fatty-acid--CoA ligase [bacterium HR40]
MNVAHFFRRNGIARADRPAVALGRKTLWTWRELCTRAARLAGSLRGRFGLAPGDRVAIFAGNLPQYVELLVGSWWAGLAAVPINARLHPSELAWIVENAGASLLFVDPALEAAAAAVSAPELRASVTIGTPSYEALFAADPVPLAEVPADTLAWLFYTSGTTGRPKGAMITHRNLRAMTHAYFLDVDERRPDGCILHAAPMSHGSGLYILPQAAIGALQVVPESGGFDEAEIFELAAHFGEATLFVAPTMLKRLVRHARTQGLEPRGFATIVYGGAPMYLADLDAAHAVFGFHLAQIYGQGESPMTITALDRRAHADTTHPRWRERLTSAGIPQSVCEVAVHDEADRPLPPGEIGEIVVRGESVVPGYWRNPQATAETLRGGWLHTGDVGCFDADGFLYLKDRSKDLVISGGANIYPREVEDVLLQHPAVREAAVIGLPDPEWGETVVACVVAEPGIDAPTLDRFCLDRMARYKRPRRYVFLESLPKNSYGKILKRELKAQLLGPRENS